jgi:hypothetical protein
MRLGQLLENYVFNPKEMFMAEDSRTEKLLELLLIELEKAEKKAKV